MCLEEELDMTAHTITLGTVKGTGVPIEGRNCGGQGVGLVTSLPQRPTPQGSFGQGLRHVVGQFSRKP